MDTDYDGFLDDMSYPNIVTMPGTTATTTSRKTKPCDCGGEMVETLILPEMQMKWTCDECGNADDV